MSTPTEEVVDRGPVARAMQDEADRILSLLILEAADATAGWNGEDPITEGIDRLTNLNRFRRYLIYDEPMEAAP
jgi:hypothetical protein